jgi:hypothetical protein
MEWGATDKDVVQSWMAFKELRRRGLVLFGIPTRYGTGLRNPLEQGWKNRWGVCTEKYFMRRISNAPEDFRQGHDFFGADVLSPDGSCLNPGDLPRILAEHLGKTDIEALFDPNEVAKEVERLAHAHRNQK